MISLKTIETVYIASRGRVHHICEWPKDEPYWEGMLKGRTILLDGREVEVTAASTQIINGYIEFACNEIPRLPHGMSDMAAFQMWGGTRP